MLPTVQKKFKKKLKKSFKKKFNNTPIRIKSLFTKLIPCISLTLLLLFSLRIKILANNTSVDLLRDTYIDYIAIDNEIIEIDDDANIFVNKKNALKISGFGEEGETITVVYHEQEIRTTVNENNLWFVLFSVSDLQDGIYPVEYRSKNDSFIICNLIFGKNVNNGKNSIIDEKTLGQILKYGLLILSFGSVASLSFFFGFKKGKLGIK